MYGVCKDCRREVRVRSTRGARLADYRCPCGGELQGKGGGAVKRGRCSICNRLTEFTVPDVGERIVIVEWDYVTSANRPVRDAVPGEHLCRNHNRLRLECGCSVLMTRARADHPGRVLIPWGKGEPPCPVHGHEDPPGAAP